MWEEVKEVFFCSQLAPLPNYRWFVGALARQEFPTLLEGLKIYPAQLLLSTSMGAAEAHIHGFWIQTKVCH